MRIGGHPVAIKRTSIGEAICRIECIASAAVFQPLGADAASPEFDASESSARPLDCCAYVGSTEFNYLTASLDVESP
jgi:hypothetical protein